MHQSEQRHIVTHQSEQRHKVTHQSEVETSTHGRRPLFIDCTQYLPRLLVAVPVSLVSRLSQCAILRLMQPIRKLKMANYRALWCTQRSITIS